MGRKIPAKKHRGVKDPLKQQEQRFQSIKDKINAPPTDPDEQPIPKSLQRLFAFKEPRTPASIVKKKKSRSIAGKWSLWSLYKLRAYREPRSTCCLCRTCKFVRKCDREATRRTWFAAETLIVCYVAAHAKHDDNPVAALKRMPGEAGRAFSMRINSAVRALHNTDQEDYPLDLEETDTRGEYIASQRERRQKKHRQAVGKEKGLGGQKGAKGEERLSKAQRRALKRKEQQKAKEAETKTARELAARELTYERVAFGDVAHAPPALPAPRRAQLHQGAPRPGRRDLLLAGMLKPSAQQTQPKTQPSKKTQAKPQISAAEQMRRERARLEAVDAYRALKKQKAAEKANR
ncbi:uncharacterized protein LOC134667794 [Cydia fagiglandana]|uniref:uncharacterized protein LOC134667794 n=1 Tax=Cydia fagiglandana TaxID=1458189 RepID=UPI002FEE2A9C